MSNKNFSFGDVISYGWSTMTANIGFFIGLGFLYLIAVFASGFIGGIIETIGIPEPILLASNISLQIFSHVIGIIIGIGLIKIALSFCDEHRPPITTLFNAFDCFWRYLGTYILYILIVIGGTLLFIVPGIIWAIKFSLAYYYVVDEGLGPIEALKASARATNTVKWELFGFGILCTLLIYAGILCLGVGIFAAFPTILIAKALVYRQLAAQTIMEHESYQPVEPVSGVPDRCPPWQE